MPPPQVVRDFSLESSGIGCDDKDEQRRGKGKSWEKGGEGKQTRCRERTRKVAAIPARRITPAISRRRFGFRPRRQFV